jgi:hypothetical protein
MFASIFSTKLAANRAGGFLPGLHSDPEDGNGDFLRNFGWFPSAYAVS